MRLLINLTTETTKFLLFQFSILIATHKKRQLIHVYVCNTVIVA